MSKRMRQGTREEIIVAKSKPNLVSQTAASSSTAPSSSASNRPVILRAPSQQGSKLMAQSAGKPVTGGSNQNEAASSSQVWLTDAKLSERPRKIDAARTNQDQSFRERARKLAAGNSDRHQRRGSRANVPHLEKVHSNLRRQLKRKPEDKMEDLDVNALIWRMFMIVTQQAAVHLGNDYSGNLHSIKNQLRNTKKQFFDVTRKLVKDEKEIQGKSMLNWQENS